MRNGIWRIAASTDSTYTQEKRRPLRAAFFVDVRVGMCPRGSFRRTIRIVNGQKQHQLTRTDGPVAKEISEAC